MPDQPPPPDRPGIPQPGVTTQPTAATSARGALAVGNVTAIIMGAVLVWGLFHAAGAYWNYRFAGAEYRVFARALIVLGCVAAYLGFWLLMLRSRARRTRDE